MEANKNFTRINNMERIINKASIYKQPKYLRLQRYVFYIFLTIVVMIFPFITINGNHIFLLSFDHKEFHFLGMLFTTQELYLMPFLVMSLFIGIFFITTIFGRIWCGWACPQTLFRCIYRDLIQTKILKIRRSIKNKQKYPKTRELKEKIILKIKEITGIFIWIMLAFIAASNFILYFVSYKNYFNYLINFNEHQVFIFALALITTFLTLNIIVFKENFCLYACPYARVQSVFYDDFTRMPLYDFKRGGELYKNDIFNKNNKKECINCFACVSICPAHIDIRKGIQFECVNCLECVDACVDVMGKLNKKTLISWDYPAILNNKNAKDKYMRFKVFGYGLMLSLIAGILIFLALGKQFVLININRGTELYQVRENKVLNHYSLLITNKSNQDYEFMVNTNMNNIQVKSPTKAFKIKPNQQRRVTLSLERSFIGNIPKSKKSVIKEKINVKAYALPKNNNDLEYQKVFVEKPTIFIYPEGIEY